MSQELREFRKSRIKGAKKIAADVAKEFGVSISVEIRYLVGVATAIMDLDINDADKFKLQVAAMNALAERGFSAGEMQSAPEFPTGMRYFQYYQI